MALIGPEIPTGAVDSANKVFTTASTINTIVWLTVDGNIYVNYVVTAPNIITLLDAPSSEIFVEYYNSTPPTPPPSSSPAISLMEAFNGLKNQLKDIQDVPQSTFVQWCEYINDFAYRYLLGVDPHRWLKTVTFNVTAGTDTYTIPSDFRDMETWDTGFFLVNTQPTPFQTLNLRLPLTGPGVQGLGYYISRGSFIFTPMPVQNVTYTQIYSVKNARLFSIDQYFTLDGTADGYPILEKEYLRYVVNALAVQYMIWDEQPGPEGYWDNRYQRTLDELCENIRRQPQAMGMLDFSQIYQNNGGGWGSGIW